MLIAKILTFVVLLELLRRVVKKLREDLCKLPPRGGG